MLAILTKWSNLLGAVSFIMVATSACNSSLRVKTSMPAGVEESNPPDPEGSPSDTSDGDNPDVLNTDDPQLSSMTLTVTTEEGHIIADNAWVKARKPVVAWNAQNVELVSVKLLIALDEQCGDVLFEFLQTKEKNRALDFLGDGTYHLCIFAESNTGEKISGINNGLKIGLDRTAPVIQGVDQYAFNQPQSPTLTVTDLSATTVQWSKLTGPGAVTFDQVSDINPHITASVEGDYLLRITATDRAGNSSSQTVALTWDITPPQFVSLLGANEAADGYINAAESTSVLTFASLTASGYSSASYTDILSDGTPITCDAGKIYGNSSIPGISTVPGANGIYALCVRLTDAAGNIAYGKSGSVEKDTVVPTVDAGGDIITNNQGTTTATASGASTYAWVKAAGTGTITFGDPTSLNTTIDASADGIYTLTLTGADAAGNSASDSMTFTMDTEGPTLTSFARANGASDGQINSTEYLSPAPLYTLTASGYDVAAYTSPMNATGLSCDGTKDYAYSTIPAISDLPGSDGIYAVCVRLNDNAGNYLFYKPAPVVRDITGPTFTSLVGANEATDGYVNNAEKNSIQPIMTLTASDYTAVSYSSILDNTPAVVCDGGISYGLGSIPSINAMTATDDSYTLCVKLTDTAGNITYGTGATIVRDTVAPTAVLSGAPAAFTKDANFNVTVSGTDVVQYSYGVQAWTSTWCSSFSSFIDVGTTITAAIGTDGYKTLCVNGRDLAGNAQTSTSYHQFALITSTPAASSSLSARDTGGYISISWNSVGTSIGNNSYVLIRGVGQGSTAGWTPVNETSYSAGNISVGLDIVYVGPTNGYFDSDLTANTIYEYAVFTVNLVLNYSATAATSTVAYYPLTSLSALEGPYANAHAQENSYFNYVDISHDALMLVVGAPGNPLDANNSNPLTSAGAVFVYTRPNTGSNWTFEQKLAGTGVNARAVNDNFGIAVAISPDSALIAVGSRNGYDAAGGSYLSTAGAVFVYKKVGGVWTLQQKIVGSGVNGRQANDTFGDNIDISNDTLVAGATNHKYDEAGTNSLNMGGAAFVYRLSADVWSPEQKLIPTGINARNTSDSFGNSVSIDGDSIVVGAYSHQFDANGENPVSGAGAAFVFTRTGSTWTQQTKLVPSGTNARMASDTFGTIVSISGDVVAVSSPENDFDATGAPSSGSGEVFLFNRTAGVWAQQQRVSPPVNAESMRFGKALSLKGNTLLAGSPYKAYDASGNNYLLNAGMAWVFDWNGSSWVETQRLTPLGTNARLKYDQFGRFVALAGTGNSLVAGSYNSWDETGTRYAKNSSSVYTFEKSGTWSQAQKITENNLISRPRADLQYGTDVYLTPDGLSLYVGAPGDRTDANDLNFTSWGVGAVYYYTRPNLSAGWTLAQKIVPFGTNSRAECMLNTSSHKFGSNIAVDGTSLAVTAPNHCYDSTGANLVIEAGAVYTYTLSGGVWIDEQKITPTGTNTRISYKSFATSVAMSGDILVVGAYENGYDDSGANDLNMAGNAYIFTRSGGVWSQTKRLVESGGVPRSAEDYFGFAVATNGTFIAIGAHKNDYDRNGINPVSDAGLVWVYKDTGGTWPLVQIIDQPETRNSNDMFGYSLTMTNTHLMVGAIGNRNGGNSTGAVFIYEDTAGTYVNTHKIIAFGYYANAVGSNFGSRTAIYGDKLLVAAWRHAYDETGFNFVSEAGSVFTFVKAGSAWFNGRKYLGFGPNGRTSENKFFGTSIGIGAGGMIVGNPNTDLDEPSGSLLSPDKGTVFLYQQP